MTIHKNSTIKFINELEDLLKAQFSLIFLRSSEEERAISSVVTTHYNFVTNSNIQSGEIARWISKDGFLACQLQEDQLSWRRADSEETHSIGMNISKAISFLHSRLDEKAQKNTNYQYTYILPDWTIFIDSSSLNVARQLKELVVSIEQQHPRPRMTLILIGMEWSIPVMLRNYVSILDLPLTKSDEIYEDIFSQAVNKYGLKEENAKSLSSQAQGIPRKTIIQIAKLIKARDLWSKPEEASQLILDLKRQEVRKTGVLEYYPPQEGGFRDVGGLDQVKDWIKSRRSWFEQNEHPRLRPRAILLEGFPGCGKSFIAKAIAQEWGLPQINFEISRLRSKFVGESAKNTFQALRAIEASAPNILFVDEIEKAFSGISGDQAGVNVQQFGTILSWLNDHRYPIFFISTSNDTEQLPPELFRAGRFDEIFVVIPPNTTERYEIIKKRMQAYGLEINESEILLLLNNLVEKTRGFSGAEIDKLVREAIYLTGFSSSKQLEIPTQDSWDKALEKVNPQYRSDKMQQLLKKYKRKVDEGGARLASKNDEDLWSQLIL